MTLSLANAILVIGIGQLCVLVASGLVPLQLDWKSSLAQLPKLMRQLFWIYGGYVVLSIISLGVICILAHDELATGTPLARAFCAYGAIFWGVRLALQAVMDVKPHLVKWWLHAGYHLLTVLFVTFTVVFTWAAIRPLP